MGVVHPKPLITSQRVKLFRYLLDGKRKHFSRALGRNGNFNKNLSILISSVHLSVLVDFSVTTFSLKLAIRLMFEAIYMRRKDSP